VLCPVIPDFFSFNITGINTEDNINFIFQFLQQPHLYIGIKTGEHPGGMIIMQELSPLAPALVGKPRYLSVFLYLRLFSSVFVRVHRHNVAKIRIIDGMKNDSVIKK
jgi:hypothetical protein